MHVAFFPLVTKSTKDPKCVPRASEQVFLFPATVCNEKHPFGFCFSSNFAFLFMLFVSGVTSNLSSEEKT